VVAEGCVAEDGRYLNVGCGMEGFCVCEFVSEVVLFCPAMKG
jgi:hypothetical protein